LRKFFDFGGIVLLNYTLISGGVRSRERNQGNQTNSGKLYLG
jgi:hypothetical protein